MQNRLYDMEQGQGDFVVKAQLSEKGDLRGMEFQPCKKVAYHGRHGSVGRRTRSVGKRRADGRGWTIFYLVWVLAVLGIIFLVCDHWFVENGYRESSLVNVSIGVNMFILLGLLLFVMVGVSLLDRKREAQLRRLHGERELQRRKRVADSWYLLWSFVISPIVFLILWWLIES